MQRHINDRRTKGEAPYCTIIIAIALLPCTLSLSANYDCISKHSSLSISSKTDTSYKSPFPVCT